METTDKPKKNGIIIIITYIYISWIIRSDVINGEFKQIRQSGMLRHVEGLEMVLSSSGLGSPRRPDYLTENGDITPPQNFSTNIHQLIKV